jgi:hypothetical protein
MAERHDSEGPTEDEAHRLRIWEEFCKNAVSAGNKAIEYLELGDIAPDEYDDTALDEIYAARWESSGVIVEAVLNHVWSEVEGLAIKLGVPFLPEIAEIHND